jgi:hypothetical protein
MGDLVNRIWQRGQELLPVHGFYFNRPLVLLQSDDWGRVGLRDHEGLEQLQSEGLTLGERAYDLYTLETAEDLERIAAVLTKHCDSSGRHPCLGMNFLLFNLDFARMRARGFRQIELMPLSEGLPEGWDRPTLFEHYREGVAAGVFRPALHGTTHFCRSAVERYLAEDGDKASLLRTLWRASTPYIYWRMPWIGYEYWDPAKSENGRFLPRDVQRELVGAAVGEFARMFSALPVSACAPGYRTNVDTHRAWAQHGIRVAQNGPGALVPPHMDRNGILQLTRTLEFEPAVDDSFSVETALRQAEACFHRGLPAILSVHSINFHSSVRDFRSRTLEALDEFLAALESKHDDLLYLDDEDLFELAEHGAYRTSSETIHVNVVQKSFTKSRLMKQGIS